MATVSPLVDNFCANLQATLARRNITQRRLAEMAGVSYVTVCRILTGVMIPSVEMCEKLAKAAQMPANEKIFRDPA